MSEVKESLEDYEKGDTIYLLLGKGTMQLGIG